MSKVNCPLMFVLAGAAAYKRNNPELAEFMDSPEEQERVERYFTDMVIEDQKESHEGEKNNSCKPTVTSVGF